MQTIIHIANYSDGVLYALALLQLLELAVILDRFWFLRRTIVLGRRLVAHVAGHGPIGPADLTRLQEHAGDLPEAAMLAAAAAADPRAPARMEARFDEAILLTAPTLDRRLWVLDTSVTLAPLLGLFGTILGMFRAFSVLGKPGTAPTAVTGGVAIALVTTAAGIFVAMVGLLAYNGLSNAVRQVVHQMETLRALLVNRLVASHPRAVAAE